MALTDTAIKAAKPREKPFRLHDERGLYLEVSPAGGKLFRFKYRFEGKEKRLSFGPYPDVSLKRARERRDEARKLLSDGIDPGEQRKSQKRSQAEAANTFEGIGREWLAKFVSGRSEGHRERVTRQLEADLFPWIGSSRPDDIDAPTLLRCLRRIENRGAVHSAHRTRSVAGQVFRYAIATGRASRDPSQDLKGAIPPAKTKSFAAIIDPEDLSRLLQAIDGYKGSLPVKCALKLTPLVFVRPGELRRARWEDIDLKASEWRFRVTKTNVDHIVPLSKQACAILNDLRPLTGSSTFVFPSMRTNARPMSENTINAALRRLGISKDEQTAHGFRATARTMLEEVKGYRPEWIERQLAHEVRDANGRAYNRTAFIEQRHAMMQDWADYLDELRKSNREGAGVKARAKRRS
ncbi:MAG: tyrosine-type recombinase/integrase [Hyphomicrobium sp.]